MDLKLKNYQLEERECTGGCGKRFKCFPTSKQKLALSNEGCLLSCIENTGKVEIAKIMSRRTLKGMKGYRVYEREDLALGENVPQSELHEIGMYQD